MILVTGGSGFIGNALVQMLRARGKSVRIFDILEPPGNTDDPNFFKGDITNERDVDAALKDVDTVYHCVALVPLLKSGDKFWRVNVEGTQILLEACRRNKVNCVVHLSSSAVFGVPECPVNDSTPLKPVEIYGRAKLAGENLVKQYMDEGRPAVIIRPRTVIGNYRLGIFQILFEWISENRNIYLIGDGNNLFQFVQVDDLAEACILAAEKAQSGIYNIGTDKFSTLKNDLTVLINSVGSKSKIKSIPPVLAINALKLLDFLKLSPLAPWHYLTYHKPFYFDNNKAITELNWKPKYSNTELLTTAYKWYLADKLNPVSNSNHQSVHRSAPKQKLLKLLKWLS